MLFLPFPSGSLFRFNAISLLWNKLQNRRTAGGEQKELQEYPQRRFSCGFTLDRHNLVFASTDSWLHLLYLLSLSLSGSVVVHLTAVTTVWRHLRPHVAVEDSTVTIPVILCIVNRKGASRTLL